MGLIDLFLSFFQRAPSPSDTQAATSSAEIESASIAPLSAPGWLSLCLPLTKASESCCLAAYPDPASGGDPWTIGWGATGPSIAKGVQWSQDKADADLESRLSAIGRQIDSYVHVALSDQQKAALGDFIYNVGIGNFESSTLLRLLNGGYYSSAADQFSVWNLAAGKVMGGLVTRRARERSLFLTGVWK